MLFPCYSHHSPVDAPRSTALALGLASRTRGHAAALVGIEGITRGGEPRGPAAWRRPAETGGDRWRQ